MALSEEEIIGQLEMQSDGSVFEDDWKALYFNPKQAPSYDAEQEPLQWLRPAQFLKHPEYFHWNGDHVQVQPGRLDDAWFLGALAAVASHVDGLVDVLFASNADDFKRYGVYTCRFYINGDWREVVCDTKLPVAPLPSNPFDEATKEAEEEPQMAPIYGRSAHSEELWVSFLEKAYAKLNGNYECLNEGSPSQALVDLTGGSCIEYDLSSESAEKTKARGELWDVIYAHLNDRGILCAQVKRKASAQPNEAKDEKEEEENGKEAISSNLVEPDPETGLLPNRLYTVVCSRHIPGAPPMMLVRNPWGSDGDWEGSWSENSQKWEDFPDIEERLAADESNPWQPGGELPGLFWMTFEDFCKEFTQLYICRIFDREAYYEYSVEGEWTGKTAAGPPTFPTKAAQGARDFLQSYPRNAHNLAKAMLPGTAAADNPSSLVYEATTDGKETYAQMLQRHLRRSGLIVPENEEFWFNNPQFKLSCRNACRITVSLQQRRGRLAATNKARKSLGLHIIKLDEHGESNSGRVWEVKNLVADANQDSLATSGSFTEVVCQDVSLLPHTKYVIIPNAGTRGREGRFCLRVFSRCELMLAPEENTHSVVVSGSWERTTTKDTCGGPPLIAEEQPKPTLAKNIPLTPSSQTPTSEVKVPERWLPQPIPNSRWCQSPQYWLRFAHRSDDPLAQSTTLKIVLRRTDRQDDGKNKRRKSRAVEEVANVGIVAVKVRSKTANLASRRRQESRRRVNALGEPLPVKESTLKQRHNKRNADTYCQNESKEEKTPQQMKSLSRKEWYRMTAFGDGDVACLALSNVTAASFPNGLLISTCLSAKGVKGTYTLEAHSSLPIRIESITSTNEQTIPSEWQESTAGGSHVHSETWKKNPKFTLDFKAVGPGPTMLKITLSRPEDNWIAPMAKDPVGAMIGFYVYSGQRPNREAVALVAAKPWSESTFVPGTEVSTPDGFALEPLPSGEVYTIMPTTYEPGNLGPFHVTVRAQIPFTLKKESDVAKR